MSSALYKMQQAIIDYGFQKSEQQGLGWFCFVFYTMLISDKSLQFRNTKTFKQGKW